MLTLFILFTLSFISERTPLNDGAGYDGAFYYSVAQNFSTDFWTTGYDSFRIFRIFPFFLINLVFSLLGIEATHANLMHSMYVLHFANLAIQIVFFAKLMQQSTWKKKTKAIIFACFFFNYFVLKNCGYEPFQTDAFAITIFLVSYYYLLREKFKRAISISFLGLLSWPTITYTIWLLYIFKDPFPREAPRFRIHTGKAIAIAFPLMSIGAIATLYLLHKQPLLESMLFMQASFPLFIIGAIAWGIFLYFALRNCDFQFHSPNTYLHEFIRQSLWKRIIILALPFAAITLFLKAHTNNEFYFNEVAFILQTLLRPLKYPLVTPAAHICYFGILPLLALVYFRDLARDIFNRSPGYALAFLAFLFFATDSEARHVIPLLPMILVPLGSVLDKANLGAKTVTALITLQIILSHFYIPINVEGTAEALATNDYYGVAQRYFMNFGPWMSPQFYLMWLSIAVISGILVYLLVRNRKN
ncbi:MAG: hypothetical protein IKS96_06210 [Fibrobacter sp.]|nr:hypothetical protein [Fibrobacter sp.]